MTVVRATWQAANWGISNLIELCSNVQLLSSLLLAKTLTVYFLIYYAFYTLHNNIVNPSYLFSNLVKGMNIKFQLVIQ